MIESLPPEPSDRISIRQISESWRPLVSIGHAQKYVNNGTGRVCCLQRGFQSQYVEKRQENLPWGGFIHKAGFHCVSVKTCLWQSRLIRLNGISYEV